MNNLKIYNNEIKDKDTEILIMFFLKKLFLMFACSNLCALQFASAGEQDPRAIVSLQQKVLDEKKPRFSDNQKFVAGAVVTTATAAVILKNKFWRSERVGAAESGVNNQWVLSRQELKAVVKEVLDEKKSYPWLTGTASWLKTAASTASWLQVAAGTALTGVGIGVFLKSRASQADLHQSDARVMGALNQRIDNLYERVVQPLDDADNKIKVLQHQVSAVGNKVTKLERSVENEQAIDELAGVVIENRLNVQRREAKEAVKQGYGMFDTLLEVSNNDFFGQLQSGRAALAEARAVQKEVSDDCTALGRQAAEQQEVAIGQLNSILVGLRANNEQLKHVKDPSLLKTKAVAIEERALRLKKGLLATNQMTQAHIDGLRQEYERELAEGQELDMQKALMLKRAYSDDGKEPEELLN